MGAVIGLYVSPHCLPNLASLGCIFWGTGKWEGKNWEKKKVRRSLVKQVLGNPASHTLVLKLSDWLLFLVGHFHGTFRSSLL